MADISAEIAAFQSAIYGEEVRGSMVSLAEKLNDVCEDNETLVNTHNTEIATAISNAQAATSAANTATTNANTATTNANTATTNANNARTAANNAATAANNAATAATSTNTSVQSAEAARVSAENARASAESTRVANEQSRQTAETARASAETSRASAESARASAEAVRQSNETTRQGNENVRQTQEGLRVSAENSRVSEFSDMQAAFADMQRQIIPQATTSTMGGVIVGDGLAVDNALLTLDVAKSSSGTIITAEDGGYLESLTVYGESVQDGTPTSENPVEIEVVEAGPNLWHESARSVGVPYTNVGITWVKNADGTYTANGTATANAWCYAGTTATIVSMAIPLDAGTYTASTNAARCALRKVSSGGTVTTLSNEFDSVSFTVEDGESIFICPQVANGLTVTDATYFVQIEKGAAATPYVPYGCIGVVVGGTATAIDLQGNHLASLPDGTRDEIYIDTTGHVTLTKKVGYFDTDNNPYTWTLSASSPNSAGLYNISASTNQGKFGYSYASNSMYYMSNTTLTNLNFSQSAAEGFGIHGTSTTVTWYFRFDAQGSTPTAAIGLARMAELGANLYYPLATPYTVDLGYIDMPTIEAGQSISVSASMTPVIDVSWWAQGASEIGRALKALKDDFLTRITSALAGAIATVEEETSAHNYSVGSYLMMDEVLYKVTTAIASGEQIVPGTNVTATTVMAEVVSLTS